MKYDQISKRDILAALFFFKSRVDLLESRAFFRQLLEIYQAFENIEAFPEWASLFEIGTECSDCDERKKLILEHLMFTFEESKILEIINKISDLKYLLEEFENDERK